MSKEGETGLINKLLDFFGRIRAEDKMQEITEVFGSYVEDQIAPLLLDLTSNQDVDPIQFISKIILVKEQVDAFVASSLRSHILFTKKVESLFWKLFSEFPKSIQFLAKYIDFELKKGEFFSLSL